MCLIIQKPAGKTVPQWIIDSAMTYNADGAGIMYAGNVHKWTDIKPAKLARKLAKLTDKEVAIHFRMATHGRVSHGNVHPFPVAGGGWLMHNGILHKYAPKDKFGDVSDTRIFIDSFLNPLLAIEDIDHEDAIRREIVGSALLIMAPDGAMQRLGAGWNEYEGLQFSNEYAWDCPNSMRGKTYDWRALLAVQNGDYVPGQYMTAYNSHYAIAPKSAADSAAVFKQSDTDSAGLPAESKYREPETVDDILTADLHTLSDDLDLTDDSAIAYEDSHLYNALVAGTLGIDEFIAQLSAETKVNLFAQLVRNGRI